MDANIPCDGPTITLGRKSNSHFQSLLPTDMFHLEFNQDKEQPEAININNEKEEGNTLTQTSEITSSVKVDTTNAVQIP